MRRDLFVFAGQSNMMGAAVYPPKLPLSIAHSYEYKHKERRLGMPMGRFAPAGYPVGEFSYADLQQAYSASMTDASGNSRLNNYKKNAYFCPAMSSLRSDAEKTQHSFSAFCEADAPLGATLAPFLAEEWEKAGVSCAYAHIAKGGVKAAYFFTDAMVEKYAQEIARFNQTNGTDYHAIQPKHRMDGAADYFFEKCADFFVDAEKTFIADTLSSRCFFWLQGESDANDASEEYELKLQILWKKLKQVGFTHFFCLRVDFFGNPSIARVMKAQEHFCARHNDAYMLTRAASYFLYAGKQEQEWFYTPPSEEYHHCRDSFFGYTNQHINEKGFRLLAERAAANLSRILLQGKQPILEEENIRSLR